MATWDLGPLLELSAPEELAATCRVGLLHAFVVGSGPSCTPRRLRRIYNLGMVTCLCPQRLAAPYEQATGGSVMCAVVQALLNCLMYKLSYYRFGEGALMATGRLGYDRVRQVRPRVATPAGLCKPPVMAGYAVLECSPACCDPPTYRGSLWPCIGREWEWLHVSEVGCTIWLLGMSTAFMATPLLAFGMSPG